MKQQLLIVASIMLVGCAPITVLSDSSNSDRTQSMVLKCSDGLAKCYSTANEICGSRGFDELDRAQGGRLTAAGRLDEQGDDHHVYREDLRLEEDQQTLAIRCK